jgi:hypothetical protein
MVRCSSSNRLPILIHSFWQAEIDAEYHGGHPSTAIASVTNPGVGRLGKPFLQMW